MEQGPIAASTVRKQEFATLAECTSRQKSQNLVGFVLATLVSLCFVVVINLYSLF